jgi:hypothetical protein
VWGEGEPELVLLHGGAQNAHTGPGLLARGHSIQGDRPVELTALIEDFTSAGGGPGSG